MDQNATNIVPNTRKPYAAPVLKTLGDLSALTAGGSLGMDETAWITMGTCGANAMKRCGLI